MDIEDDSISGGYEFVKKQEQEPDWDQGSHRKDEEEEKKEEGEEGDCDVDDDSVTSLKDLNASDRKKLTSNVIHGRKASTYLRIFRDDEGLTDNDRQQQRQERQLQKQQRQDEEYEYQDCHHHHQQEQEQQEQGQQQQEQEQQKQKQQVSIAGTPSQNWKNAKTPASLYDTHYKFSAIPKRKSLRSQGSRLCVAAKQLEPAISEPEDLAKQERREQQQTDLSLKPVSSATYYPHKSRDSTTEPSNDRNSTGSTAIPVVPRFQYRGTSVAETEATTLASVTHEHVARSPERRTSGTISEAAVESDEDYYDDNEEDEEEKNSLYPLAVELQPFTNNVGGHTAIFRFSKRAVCKALVNRENRWYENIEVNHKELLQFMPRYIGVLNVRQHFHNKGDFLRELSSSKRHQQEHKALPSSQWIKQYEEGQRKVENVKQDQIRNGSKLSQQETQVKQDPGHNHNQQPSLHQTSSSKAIFCHNNGEMGGLPEVVLSDNRHMVPDSMLSLYPPDSPNSFKTDSFLQPTGNSSGQESSGSTTVNTKLKELVLQEVFALSPGEHDVIEGHFKRTRRPSGMKKIHSNSQGTSSQSNSRRGSNFSLKNVSSQGSSSPLLKKSIQETISHSLNSPSSMMDLRQFQRKEMVREKSQLRSSSSSSVKDEHSGNISPLSLPRDHPLIEEYAVDNDDHIDFSLDGKENHNSSTNNTTHNNTNDNSNDSVVKSDQGKDSESITFEEHSDTIVSKFILLEDLTRKLSKPCALDLKMGTRQYGLDAKQSKQRSQREKCLKTTSKKLGVRICGLKIWNQTYYITRDKYFGRRVQAGWQFTRVLARFIYDGAHISSIVRQIPRLVRQLDTLGSEIANLKGYRLYGSSLLLMFDGSNLGNKRCRVKVNLIDFARCVTKEDLKENYDSFRIPPKNPDVEDRGFLKGVRSLKFYLMSIWNYLTSDAPLCNDDEELQMFLQNDLGRFNRPWDWLDEFDKENEEEFNSPESELRKKWRKYELIFDSEPRFTNDGDISD